MSWDHLVKVDEDPDEVKIAGQTVKRPDHLSPREWLELWERVKYRDLGFY